LLSSCANSIATPSSSIGVTSQAPASRPVAGAARFTKPRVRGGAPSFSWVFGGNSEQVDVYDETTKAFVSTCSTCQGISLAISPKSGDLAVGNSPNEVTVWHVSASGIWSTHEFTVYESLEYTALQSIGYPIGNSGGETVGDQGVGCDSCQLYYPYRSVALYPQPAT
jgi:hypothetical protein